MADTPSAGDPAAEALARARSSARGRPAPTTGRGTPRRTGLPGSAPSADRDPIPVGDALTGLIADRGWSEQAAVGALSGRWEQIVGPDIAGHVVMEGFDAARGTLILRADSTAWATQIRLLLPQLMTRLQEELGHGVVSEVTVAGPAAPSWVKGPRTAPGRGPRDTYG